MQQDPQPPAHSAEPLAAASTTRLESIIRPTAIVLKDVLDDLGPLGGGVSNARYIRTTTLDEYVMKGPALAPDNPYIGMNELLSVQLARLAGLPTLDFCLLRFNGQLFFGSTYLQRKGFYARFTEALLAKCTNRDDLYNIVAFDIWLCHMDRHPGNLIVRHTDANRMRGTPERNLLLVNDHSHCPIFPDGSMNPANLPALASARVRKEFVRIGFVANAIVDEHRLSAAIERIEVLSDDLLSEVVCEIPEEFLPLGERESVVTFLTNRRDLLRSIIRDGRWVFPKLGRGGAL